MLRAYGDRELFRQHRWRFLLAPPLVLALSWTFFIGLKLHGLELLLLFWATWHIMMQTYGFLRIYDAKRGRTGRWAARLDFWACTAVFASGVLFSDARLLGVVETMQQTGLPVFGPEVLSALRWLVGGASAAVLGTYLVVAVAGGKSGGVHYPKLLLLAGTALLFWFAGRLSVNLLIGVAMFEVFHAVQYFAIVWFTSRRRATTHGEHFGPLGVVFRSGRWGMAVYLAAIAAFGSIAFWGRWSGWSVAPAAAMMLFSASAMLHFYYDGFIWRVRRRPTRDGLNIAAPAAADEPAPSVCGTGSPGPPYWRCCSYSAGRNDGLDRKRPGGRRSACGCWPN